MKRLEFYKTCRIVEETLKNGGYSYKEYADGYMVSLYGSERKISTRDHNMNGIVEQIQDFFEYYGTVNTWFVEDTDGYGTIYLDVSVNIKDLDEAMEFAKDNKQLAIYDCRAGNVIEVA